jgi:hypothetical protein
MTAGVGADGAGVRSLPPKGHSLSHAGEKIRRWLGVNQDEEPRCSSQSTSALRLPRPSKSPLGRHDGSWPSRRYRMSVTTSF